MKEAWKNNNTLIKFKESTPIEQRDEIAKFQKEYDAKWNQPGRDPRDLMKRKVNRFVKYINDHVKRCKDSLNIDMAVFCPSEKLAGKGLSNFENGVEIFFDLENYDMFDTIDEYYDWMDETSGDSFNHLEIIRDAYWYVVENGLLEPQEVYDDFEASTWANYQLSIGPEEIPDVKDAISLLSKIANFSRSDKVLDYTTFCIVNDADTIPSKDAYYDPTELRKVANIISYKWGKDDTHVLVEFRQDAINDAGIKRIPTGVQKSFDEFWKIVNK